MAIVAGAIFLLTDASTPSSRVKSPMLRLTDLRKTQPGPEATKLRLAAYDFESCTPEEKETEVAALKVDETPDEVIIKASLRIYEGKGICEIYSASEGLVVTLDRPLGQREVVDDSRGLQKVIWSPAMRGDVLRALQVTARDAERFIDAEYPGTHKETCTRFEIHLFACSTRYPGRKRMFINVVVLPTGELSAQPG